MAAATVKKEEAPDEAAVRTELIRKHVQALRKDLEGLSTSDQDAVLAEVASNAKVTKAVADVDRTPPPPVDPYAEEKNKKA